MTELTTKSVNKGRAVSVIHTDFSKDFDMASHYILGPKAKILESGQADN